MDYNTLVARLQQADCTSKSDAEAAEFLNAKNIVETYSRFGSFRTLAGLLTADEYAALKTALTAAAQGQPVVADMIEMLKLPGDEQGNGGGVDFGSPRVADTLAQLVQGGLDTAIAAKMTGLRPAAGQHCRATGVRPRSATATWRLPGRIWQLTREGLGIRDWGLDS